MPLVEIVPAPWTDSDVVDRTVALMKEIGQAPVVTKKEVNGFIFNRLQYAIIMEAWRLVEVREVGYNWILLKCIFKLMSLRLH